jgi:hypothetical protein
VVFRHTGPAMACVVLFALIVLQVYHGGLPCFVHGFAVDNCSIAFDLCDGLVCLLFVLQLELSPSAGVRVWDAGCAHCVHMLAGAAWMQSLTRNRVAVTP